MLRTISVLSALVLAVTASGPAFAVSLGMPITSAPVISGTGTGFHDLVLGFDLLGDGAATSTPPAAAEALLVTVPFADFGFEPAGKLFVTRVGSGASFLSGDLAQVGLNLDPAGPDRIELLFGNLGGSSAAAFGPFALLALSGEFGADPVGAGFGSFSDPVDVGFTVSAAVPLPASLLGLLAGIGGLIFLGRTRSKEDVQVKIALGPEPRVSLEV